MAEDSSYLLEQAIAGQTGALRALLERCGPRIWHEIHHDIGPQWQAVLDADDVMQITYMEAFLQIDQLAARDEQAFVAWLRRIAANNLRDAIRELERKKRPHPARRVHALADEESLVALVELLGATSATPSRHVVQDEASSIVNAVLDRLPPDYHKVVRLYDLDGRDIADVAEAIGRSRGAVHMLRARAHDRLRKLLGSETDFFSRAT